MYVFDVHRPIRMMVSVVAPASLRAMAPPALRLCDDTRSSVALLKEVVVQCSPSYHNGDVLSRIIPLSHFSAH